MSGSGLVIEIERDDGLGERNPRIVADGSRWHVRVGSLEGFGGVTYEVSTQEYAQYDGSLVMRERTPEQDRTLVLVAASHVDPAEARDEALAFFVPHREYTVRCTAFGRTRHFSGVQYALDVELGYLHSPTAVTWTCLSSQPYWLSEDEHGYDIAEAVGYRCFPFVSLADTLVSEAEEEASAADEQGPLYAPGFLVGVISHETRLTNYGHVPTYPRFVVGATGDVSNPSLRVVDSSGEAVMDVTVLVDMEEGDELVIDFEARPTAVELNGENVLHLVKPGSTLAASIGIGEYDVEWRAESGDVSMQVTPSIRDRYTGV